MAAQIRCFDILSIIILLWCLFKSKQNASLKYPNLGTGDLAQVRFYLVLLIVAVHSPMKVNEARLVPKEAGRLTLQVHMNMASMCCFITEQGAVVEVLHFL